MNKAFLCRHGPSFTCPILIARCLVNFLTPEFINDVINNIPLSIVYLSSICAIYHLSSIYVSYTCLSTCLSTISLFVHPFIHHPFSVPLGISFEPIPTTIMALFAFLRHLISLLNFYPERWHRFITTLLAVYTGSALSKIPC
jgi:hypothetical protein